VSRTAFLFPGQGSQRPGMGRALRDAFPESRAVFEEADDVLRESLSTLCFEGPEEDLRRTRNTQPAMLTVSYAAWRAAAVRGAGPDMAAGHSLGEYSALVALGGLSFADALRLTRRRAEFMQEAVPEGEGAMAAVLGLPAETVAEVASEVTGRGDGLVEPANFNGGGQVVIGGHTAAVSAAGKELKSRGARRVLPLPVSAPFHTRLMEPAAARLAAELDAIPFRDLVAPLWTNVDAAPVRTGAEAPGGAAPPGRLAGPLGGDPPGDGGGGRRYFRRDRSGQGADRNGPQGVAGCLRVRSVRSGRGRTASGAGAGTGR